MPVTGVPGTTSAAAPPSEVENALTAARTHGDWDTYAQVLFTADVFTYVPRQAADQLGPEAEFPVYDGPAYGGAPGAGNAPGAWGAKCHVVHTRGELLPQRPDLVPLMVPMPLESEKLHGGRPAGLWVNPGTPSEAYFPGADDTVKRWKALQKQALRNAYDGEALVTKYTGQLHGPLAHALACGAHLAVHRRVFWNEIGDVYDDYLADRDSLRDPWGVTERGGWQEQLNHLLNGHGSPPQHEFVLTVRRDLAQSRPGAHTDPRAWTDAAVGTLRSRGVDEREVAVVTGVIGQITHWEARFRADGVLPPDGFVATAAGYDYGRAVNFARWGLGAQFATAAETEQAVLRAAGSCRERYASWEEFSAGYLLGRVLAAGFEAPGEGDVYGAALTAHRILTGDPASPWRNLPFREPDQG